MPKLYNLARMTTATTGTGTITLGSAVSGYLTFALAGISTGEIVSYGIKDGANSEIGTGTYTSAGTTLTRSVTKSTNSNNAISLSGTAEVFITPRAEDLVFVSLPQGRLTLQTAVPVMTTTQSAKTTIYYTPYVGNQVPIYDGTSFRNVAFSELSVATSDATKSPAVIGASKVNDWFVWDDAGTTRIGHGPDWTDDTTRSAGTALTRVNGIYLNNALTNGPAASRGTYVGTTRSNASSQLDWIYGAVAASGTAGFFGVWNAYNRVKFSTFVGDSTDSWSYAVANTWRSANASATMRVTVVRGLDEDSVSADYRAEGVAGAATICSAGVGLDSTTAFSGNTGFSAQANAVPFNSQYAGNPGLGVHFFQAIEYNSTTTASTWYGDVGTAYVQTGLHVNCVQ
jgi:hypothetical protein